MAGKIHFVIFVTVLVLISCTTVVLSASAKNQEEGNNEVAVLNAKVCTTRKHNVQDCSCLRTTFKDTGCTEILGSQFIKSKFEGADPGTCIKHFRYCYSGSDEAGLIDLSEKRRTSQCCRSMLCYMKLIGGCV
ncbi:hypothetical protein ACHWQZ_G019604 [Mnemiopsis leidyi]